MRKALALVLALGMTAAMSAVPAFAEAAPEYTFTYAELNGDDNINSRVGYKFAEYVDELSEGRIKIDVFTASQLGDEITCLNALQMGGGTVDFYRGNTNSLGDYGIKKMNLFGLPYIFTSREGMWKVLEAEDLGQAFLNEGVEVGAGFVGITYTDEGARHTFTSMEITCLDDLAGKIVGVQQGTSADQLLTNGDGVELARKREHLVAKGIETVGKQYACTALRCIPEFASEPFRA